MVVAMRVAMRNVLPLRLITAKKHLLSTGILSSALIFNPGSSFAETQKTYSFGVVPQQSAKRLAKLWTPILKYVNAQTGLKLKFKTAKNIPTFEKRLANGDYDFAYMNPYHFTVFSQNPGYTAVAKRIDQPIKGIVVTRKDSTVKSLSELEDTRLAFPSPAAFAASVLPRAKLKQEKIDFEPRYVSSHDSVYLGVAKGLFKAGGGVLRTFNNTSPAVREQLQVLWTTKPYTPHAIAAHPALDADVAERIGAALVAMNDNPKGQALLRSIKVKKGLETAQIRRHSVKRL